jgi:hypothetical protein
MRTYFLKWDELSVLTNSHNVRLIQTYGSYQRVRETKLLEIKVACPLRVSEKHALAA